LVADAEKTGIPKRWIMSSKAAWVIRSSRPGDRDQVLDLIQTTEYLHQHFDWVDALSLLDEAPYVMALRENKIVGCLACPPDPPGVSWVRLFTVGFSYAPSNLWGPLWHEAESQAQAKGVKHWLAPILENSGFRHSNDVVFLEWKRQPLPPTTPEQGSIRTMQYEDLANVTALDQRAFGTIWRYSEKTLQHAFRSAAVARVIEVENRIVAYQISTESHYGAHLARLAVDPNWQRHGFGRTLVVDAIRRLMRTSNWRMSVNTQLDNTRSLQLYQQLGFIRKGHKHPVYELTLIS
jgi:ribosomal-protein-alanine N-acetyltransferase